MAHSEPVAITGLGAIGAFGPDTAALDAALREGRDGVGLLTLWDSPLSDFPVAQVRDDLDALLDARLAPSERLRRRLNRGDTLALLAAAEALGQAGLEADTLARAGAGVYVGESVCGTHTSEAIYIGVRKHPQQRHDVRGLLRHEGANTLDILARCFGLPGPSTALMTACSSGANAIGLAAELIRAGRARVMLAGGADSLSQIAFNGFCALKVVSPDGPRPFDAQRTGMMLGEGAGMLVLESLAHARERGANVLALLTGYGHSCDAYHLTAPHPEGRGRGQPWARRWSRRALRPPTSGTSTRTAPPRRTTTVSRALLWRRCSARTPSRSAAPSA
jgi:3-oxoacyl-[acyl-carrier-protein] synthase II